MKVAIETITPEIAKFYLQFNSNNRPLKKSVVETYANEMRAERWRLTHQGLAFDRDGTLLDGQHRLAAIVSSGAHVEMLVARGIETKTQIVMDDHAKRTAGDALSLCRKESITQRDIAIIRAAVTFGKGGNDRSKALSKQELDGVFDQFRPGLEFAKSHMENGGRGVDSAPVRASVMLAWYYVDNIDRLKEFCSILSGKDLPDSDEDKAGVTLREWLLRTGINKYASRVEAFRKTQRAIVAFNERKPIGKLYGVDTYFPWPLVDPVRR